MHDRLNAHGRRQIPAVDRILDALGRCDLPRPVVVDVIRRKLAGIRVTKKVPDFESIVALVRRSLEELSASRLQPIHALKELGSGYSNLEYDLATGGRGQRGSYIENALALLCKAEAATVVNNCAAALVLIVGHFTRTKTDVVISRGELVQIGGGFRIGEIIEATGAKLREVGATNKTTVDDYADAIGQNTAMILKVHRSNFFMSGFVESPSSDKISELARRKRIPFVEDLGSGAVAATEEFGIDHHEPTPADVLKSGVDLVCFSGDKLFGGPQAGIIAGKKRFIGALRREPVFRALRCDKLCLAALQATVDLHLNQQPGVIPTLGLLQISEDELRARATSICNQLSQQSYNLQVAVGSSVAKVGGGTLPKSKMPSVVIEIVPGNCSPLEFASRLRSATPPVIGYVANDCFKLDVRTIFPEQDDLVVAAIRAACMK
ncbi:MAG: L-seryl-tRNA(Sec) selenium transferase [Verrucomicrobia bacterium]|nr:MAG: L-seryl-tRNA(Sec) selenium transferase [Verrucomicrobiota bacterium]